MLLQLCKREDRATYGNCENLDSHINDKDYLTCK